MSNSPTPPGPPGPPPPPPPPPPGPTTGPVVIYNVDYENNHAGDITILGGYELEVPEWFNPNEMSMFADNGQYLAPADTSSYKPAISYFNVPDYDLLETDEPKRLTVVGYFASEVAEDPDRDWYVSFNYLHDLNNPNGPLTSSISLKATTIDSSGAVSFELTARVADGGATVASVGILNLAPNALFKIEIVYDSFDEKMYIYCSSNGIISSESFYAYFPFILNRVRFDATSYKFRILNIKVEQDDSIDPTEAITGTY